MMASGLRLTPHHFRDRDMREMDIVLDRDDGMIAGIEVKVSANGQSWRPWRPAGTLRHRCGPL